MLTRVLPLRCDRLLDPPQPGVVAGLAHPPDLSVADGQPLPFARLVDRTSAWYRRSMKATTIKVEGELLAQLEQTKPRAQSLTTYVRSVLKREVRRQQMITAAERYTEFLAHQPDERAWLDAWDRADLAGPPRRKRG
jgi:hypothetical protein